MNLSIFLKEVDQLSAELSQEDLAWFVHEVARTLPEEKRNYFWKTLTSVAGLSESGGLKPSGASMDKEEQELTGAIEEIKKKLSEINVGARCLDSKYNEEWDDWYNSDVPEVLFMDPQKIIPDINRAMALIHECVDKEVYREGRELAEILSLLEVSAAGDYDDCNGSPLRLDELSDNELLLDDFTHFAKECLYLTYMGNMPADRADELFCMIKNFKCFDISLEDIMQAGNTELSQFDEFVTLWIAYLGVQKDRYAEKLLKEAQLMLTDEQTMLDNAIKFVDVHPSLYEQLLQMKMASGEDGKMFGIGKEALEKISSAYKVRSGIALLTAEYAGHLNNYDGAEQCWVEAFRSDSTPMNYLRVRMQTRDWSQYQDKVKSIYESIYIETKEIRPNRNYAEETLAVNRLHEKDYCVLLFFDKQFDKMLAVGMSARDAVGWSSTFMKEGMALLLLLLYQGGELPGGLKAMLVWAVSVCRFATAEYCRGTAKVPPGNVNDNNDMFWQLFKQWKESVEIAEGESSKWLDRIAQWIARRVAGIMERSRRNYYGECASYIAAFGEVQESRGAAFAKLRIMEQYRSEYSRRSAFHQELRTYGMKK